MFNYETDPAIDDERIENAGRQGCNAAEISVHWDRVYPNRNSAPNWRVVDSHVNTALRMGMKVALRILVSRDPGNINGFWSDQESMRAGDNSPMNFAGAVQFSYAHQPTLEMAKGFVREVAQHFQYLQNQDNLLFMSVVASPIQEAEYSPRNGRSDGSNYQIPFDYSEPMKQAFRQWLQGRYSLAELNRRWGSDFSRWETVIPPPYNQSDPLTSFSRGLWGQDWYVFRHLMLKRFLDETTRTIREVNGAIQVVNQHGSVWDRQSGLRGTFSFKNLAQNADGVKINDSPDYNHRFSMDVLRSNLRSNAWVCNEVDGLFHSSVSVGRFYEQVEESFAHGARLVTLANFGGADARPLLNQLIQQVVGRGLLNQPVTQVQTGSSTSYKLSTMVRDDGTNPAGRASDQWSRQYAQNGRRPVQIDLIEDWLEDNSNQDPRVSQPIPNQTAYLDRPFEFSIPPSTFEDPDGSITKVEIISGLPALGLSANGTSISGTPNATGTITVTVRAIDNKNSPVTTQFQINVPGQNNNQPPVVARAIADRSTYVGQPYTYSIPAETFSDPDGRIVSINAGGLPGGLNYIPATNSISGTPENVEVSTIIVKATDDKGSSVTTTFKLTITRAADDNKPPVVAKAVPDQTATVGQSFSFAIPAETFSDPDGQINALEVSSLPAGMNFDAGNRTISGTPTTAGKITVTVKAFDNKGASVTTDFRLTINPSSAPEQLALLEPTIECSTGRITFRTSGGNGSTIEFRAVGITNDWTPNATFTIDPWLRNGVTFEITARQSGREVKYTYTTTCQGYDPPSVVKPIADQSYFIGMDFTFTIPLETFKSSAPLTGIDVSDLPPGLSYDKNTRTISGKATRVGATNVHVTATDERGGQGKDDFILTFREPPALELIDPAFNCQNGRLTIRTNLGDGTPISYAIDGISDWTGNPVFSIEFSKWKGAQLTLRARQGSRQVSMVYTTNCTVPGSSTITDQTAIVGQIYIFTLPSLGNDVTMAVSGLPEGLSYDSGTRTISGTPKNVGNSVVTIKVTDNKGATTEVVFNLTVKPVDGSVSGNFEGYLDAVNCISFGGWVWDQNQPNTPIVVEFLAGTSPQSATVVGSILADINRPDLRAAGKGNGIHGFAAPVPDNLKNNQTITIWARVQGST
ncbi:putative Ig domain-containing protein, partial [Larkinella soli]|uniref:putative Ig domain-containing protein n=1 Tax=Larkinella soli TaxID=1770527 RepID=UPI0013E2FC50